MPFLLTGLGINQFLSFYKNFRRHLHKVEVVSGVVLIIVGLLVMSGQSTLLTSSKVLAWIPNAESWLKLDGQNSRAANARAEHKLRTRAGRRVSNTRRQAVSLKRTSRPGGAAELLGNLVHPLP